MGSVTMTGMMRSGLVLLLVLGATVAKNENAFSRLIDDLFADGGYEKDAIPMLKPADKESNINAINVGVGMSIIDLDYDPSDVLSASTWFKATWEDYRLKWDPDHYEGLTSIKVPASRIWTPDLSVYNAADFGAGSFSHLYANNPTNAIIYVVTSQKGDAIQTKYYDCCKEPYLSMNYVFTIQKAYDIVDGKKVLNKTPESLDELFEMYKVTFTHD